MAFCHSCGIGCSCGLDSVPGLGTSICHGCGHLKKKKRGVKYFKMPSGEEETATKTKTT